MRYIPSTAPYAYPQAEKYYSAACRRALLLTIAQGGCTINIQGIEATTGYAVATATNDHPTRALQLESIRELTVEILEEFVKANLNLLVEPKVYLGTWHDKKSGRVYLDITAVIHNLRDALAAAREFDQIAVHDLKTGEDINNCDFFC